MTRVELPDEATEIDKELLDRYIAGFEEPSGEGEVIMAQACCAKNGSARLHSNTSSKAPLTSSAYPSSASTKPRQCVTELGTQ